MGPPAASPSCPLDERPSPCDHAGEYAAVADCYPSGVPRTDSRPRVLAIVPAWNEQDSVGRRFARFSRSTPRSTSSSSTTVRATRPPSGPRRPAPGSPACPSTWAWAARCAPAIATGARGVRHRRADRCRRPARPALPGAPDRRARPRRHLHRRALRQARRPLHRARAASLGDVPARLGAEPTGRHEAHRRHVRLPGLQPPRHGRSSPSTTRPSTSATPSSRW